LERIHVFGVGLLAFSIPFTATSLIILGSIPLAALGIGLAILSSSILLTPAQPIPPQAVRAMLEGSVLTLEALLEEFDISNRGYYVCASDGRVYLYVPLAKDSGPPRSRDPPSGLIHKEGASRYLVLIPPASELVKTPQISGMHLEPALSYVLTDLTEAADSVDVLTNGFITIRLRRPRSHISAGRFKLVFGSLEASIAACIAASITGLVRVVEEVEEGGDRIVVLEVLGG